MKPQQNSTKSASPRRTKRHAQPLAIVILRYTFSLLGVLAPRLAARLVNYLWFRPQRHATPAREQTLLMQARCHPLTHAGKHVSVYVWGEGPTVLLVHGWSGRGAQLGEFVAPLVQAGFRVVGFDAPAHGRSDGHDTTLPEISEVILKLAQNFAPVHAAIAHSFGVPCVMYALQQQEFAKRVVALSAPATMEGLLDKFAHQLVLSRRTLQHFRDMLQQRFGDNVWTRFSAQAIAPSMGVPSLIIHDHDDRDVSWREGEAIANAWPHARFLRTEGLGHRRILRDRDVIGRAVDFIGHSTDKAAAREPAITPGQAKR